MMRFFVNVTVFIVLLTFPGCVSHHHKTDIASSLHGSLGVAQMHITECQLLWNKEKIAAQGVSRQRNMYAAASRLRLSEKAVDDGFHASTREEGMREFNRAWRFNPENGMAYWGAGVVRGCEALKYQVERDIARRCWNDCLRLFEMGSQFLTHSSKVTICEFNMDWAASCRLFAAFLQGESKAEAETYLRKAEKLLLPYRNCALFHPEGNRRVSVRVAHELWKVYALLGKDDEAMKCKEERDRLNAVNPIPEIDMSDTSGRWME